jgi:hypothetical protein
MGRRGDDMGWSILGPTLGVVGLIGLLVGMIVLAHKNRHGSRL